MMDTLQAYHSANRELQATEGRPHAERVDALRRANDAWRDHFIPHLRARDRERTNQRALASAALGIAIAQANLTDDARAAIRAVYHL